jgi:hypothetical protein
MTVIADKAHRTAISRKALSKPAAWLDGAGYLQGRVLDYGCGRGGDAERLGCEGYDPYYQPERPVGPFTTVMSNFVLNVIESAETRRAVLEDIDALLEEKGHAYITVRADKKALKGCTSIGTWQGLIVLGLPIVHRRSGHTTYIMSKGCSDCSIDAVTFE